MRSMRHLKTIFFAVIFLFAASAVALAQATDCAEDDHDCLIAFYSKALKSNPKDVESYYNLGRAHQLKGNVKEAIENYDRYLAAGITDPESLSDGYNNRAIAHRAAGDLEKAAADYTKAIELRPENASFYVNRGNVFVDLKRHDDAIKDYDKAISLEPEKAAALIGRGLAYSAAGNADAAINDFTKALEIAPEPEAYYNRGVLYSQKREFAKAVADYTKYIESDVKDTTKLADGYLNRAIAVYYSTNDAERSIADATEAIKANPNLVNAYRVRALLYREVGKNDLSAADEKKAAELAGSR